MVKKFLSVFLIIVALMYVMPISGRALEENTADIIRLADGSYIEVTVEQYDMRRTNTKSGKKNYVCRSEDGTELWIATLHGTFTYNGTTATCTSSSFSFQAYDDAWYLVSDATSRSGAMAYTTFTAGKKLLGVTILKETQEMTLTCSPTGTLS